MEHSQFIEKDHSDTTAFALAHVGAQFDKKRFDITPLNVSTRRARENQFKCPLMLPLHAEMVL